MNADHLSAVTSSRHSPARGPSVASRRAPGRCRAVTGYVGAVVIALGAAACGTPADSENAPGPYTGTFNGVPSGAQPVPGAPPASNTNGATGVLGPVSPSNPGGEQTGADVPLDGASNGASAGNAATNDGAGGSASAPPAMTGEGGSSMAGAAGAGMTAPGGAQGTGGAPMPPSIPPPVTPPPVTPPPVQGRGCAEGVAFFCEDFESRAVGTAQANADWSPSSNNGSVSIDGMLARGGARSLRIQTQGNGNARINLLGFAPPNNSLFGRMYLQAEAFPTAPAYAHFTLVEAAGTSGALVRPIGGQFIPDVPGTFWGPGTDRGPSGDWTNWQATVPTEAGRWICMEWEMNAADNNMNIWLDGVAKPELSVSTTDHPLNTTPFTFPDFDRIWIGWELYQGGPTPNQFTLWFDDIVLSTERVGC